MELHYPNMEMSTLYGVICHLPFLFPATLYTMSAPITAARNASKSAPKKTQGAMQASGVSQQLFKRHVILGLVKSVNGITEEILPAGQFFFSPTLFITTHPLRIDDDDNNGGDNGHENASKNASTNESGPSDVQKTPGIYPEVVSSSDVLCTPFDVNSPLGQLLLQLQRLWDFGSL